MGRNNREKNDDQKDSLFVMEIVPFDNIMILSTRTFL